MSPATAEAHALGLEPRGLRILLVEDYEIDARIFFELLELVEAAERPSVTHVPSVAEAIDKLAANAYDCVLLDLGLPDSDGLESIERIRAAARRATIVVMTGLDDEKRAVEALRRGAQEYLVKGRLDHKALMRQLRHAVQRNGLLSDLDRQRELQQQLAGRDPLTGLVNRQFLTERVREAIAFAAQRGERLALSFLDLDGFKGINDRLGHAVGDAVLIKVASVLQSTIRATDLVARLGGDEFVTLQYPAGSDAEIQQTGARIVEAVGNIRQIEGHAIRMGVSIGTAIYPDHGQTMEQLLRRADEVMYAVKRGGGNGTRVRLRPVARPSGADTLLSSDQATLLYQPWISATGQPAGFEALLRQRSGNTLLSPENLLQSLERMEAQSVLTSWLLRTSLRQWQRWRGAGIWPGRLALNMSAIEVGRDGFPDEVEAALEQEGAPAGLLQIEIAEHLLDAPSPQLLDNLRKLRRRAVRVVIDCYGRDQGSLRKLLSLPIDGVKLDCSVLSGLGTDDIEHRALIAGVVHAAGVRGLDVVAVGVEREAQARSCRQLDCPALQGWWLLPPVGPEHLLAALGHFHRRPPLLQPSAAATGQPPI